jgi:hypothetical protein
VKSVISKLGCSGIKGVLPHPRRSGNGKRDKFAGIIGQSGAVGQSGGQ